MTEAEKLVEDVAASMFEDMQRRRYEGRMPSPWPPHREIAEEWRHHARAAITRLTAPAAVDVRARLESVLEAHEEWGLFLSEEHRERLIADIHAVLAPPRADEEPSHDH